MYRPLCLLLVVACRPEDPEPGTSTSDTDLPAPVREARFDAVADALLDELGPNLAEGVSIAVMEGGVYTWVEGFGTADPEGSVPVGPDTLFQIGSTTKQMTAAVVLQQVERGQLSLSDPMDAVLPEFSLAADPTWSPGASLHELLSHQGGLVDYLDWTGSSDDAELAAWHHDFFGPNLYPMNPPGLFWNYSNPNFTLAGLAAEAHDAAGRYYADLLMEDLFEPLGMTSTFIRKTDVQARGDFALSVGVDVADPYTFEPLPMRAVPDPASARPAGLVWSTPSDMCRWGSFLTHGDPSVLGDPLRAEITSPHVSTLSVDDHLSYGYGAFVWDLYPMADGYYPLRVWEHGGNTLSFTSVLFVLPDEDVQFSILSNGYGDVWTETVEALLRAVVTPFPAASDYAGPALDAADLSSHVGSYLDPYNVGEVQITEGGAHGLQIAMPLLDDYGYSVGTDLTPISTDVWLVEIDGLAYDLTFVRDPAGGSDPWIRNRAFVGGRVDVPMSAVRRAAPSRDQVEEALRRARVSHHL